ncbi:MAG: hypothetical protein N2Z23_01885 [Pyrinomonadaceae bacterium]|nr:hypothetical protein [Pyrinomonadaceae bacterium]MCX7639180.1 hypothetical protein [Pyrinomonadaceae bacterium]MDW8303599.1 hypothetical protein [Acidobacteriota bacterium]
MMMYRQTKFSEILYKIREELSREADYDALKFAKIFLKDEKVMLAQDEANQKGAKRKNENFDLICKDDLEPGRKSI